MSIFVTGDTHGGTGIFGYVNRFSINSFPEQADMTKDTDYVVVCGDFGGVWNLCESMKEKVELDMIEERCPFTLLFVPGNHENYDRLMGIPDKKLLDSWLYDNLFDGQKEALKKGYPRKWWHGGYVREIRPHILMLERGFTYDIDGCKCFAFGGAPSHDIKDGILNPMDFNDREDFSQEYMKWNNEGKDFRVKHVSWWPQEMPSDLEKERGLGIKNPDFIFTHEAPFSDALEIVRNPKVNDLSGYFEKLKCENDYKKWFFGHYHVNWTCAGGKDVCLYEQIIRIN